MATPAQIHHAKIQFAQWLAKKEPFLFKVAEKAAEIKKAGGVAGVGFLDIDWGDLAKSVTETVKEVAPAVIQYKAQSSALKTNMKRAEQGLPPIDYAQYTPAVRIQPEISPQTEQVIVRLAEKTVQSTGDKIKEFFPYILAGTAVLFVALRRRR